MSLRYDEELAAYFGDEDMKLDRLLYLLEQTRRYESRLYWMKLKVMIFGIAIPSILSVIAIFVALNH
ncbi:hypothetical protein L1D34_14600 [Vibrio mediterranei]|uniref:hypothetical protein n=1 Tax=Vibrio mediterranei TaxID=689 RepID=UPI00148D4C00|nr:hypothetical protein [Vibrio mediterranei]MCG9626068.1 hypothetical protein [Vibrio mediterranei]NOI21863.1 hypothetical protein [Vibrio mediterranei]